LVDRVLELVESIGVLAFLEEDASFVDYDIWVINIPLLDQSLSILDLITLISNTNLQDNEFISVF
jgi:hypothetical protein